MSFKAILKDCLLRAGITQKQLAEKIGTSPTSLNYYVIRDITPKEELLHKIVGALADYGIVVSTDIMQSPETNLEAKIRKILDKIKRMIYDKDVNKKEIVEKTGVNLPEDDKIPKDYILDKLSVHKIARSLNVNPDYFFSDNVSPEPLKDIEDLVIKLPVIAHVPDGFGITIPDSGIEYLPILRSYIADVDPKDVYVVKVMHARDTENVTLKIEYADYLIFAQNHAFNNRDVIVLKEASSARALLRRYVQGTLYPQVETKAKAEAEAKCEQSSVESSAISSIDFPECCSKIADCKSVPNARYTYVGKVLSVIRLRNRVGTLTKRACL